MIRECVLHLKSDKIEMVINDEDDFFFDLLKNRHPNNLKSMKSSEFVFDYLYLLYYKSLKINPNQGGSYIASLYWIKTKKTAKNLINKKDVFNML